MTVKERLKGRIWGISLLASIVLIFAVWNVDATPKQTSTGAASESNALVPCEHDHRDGWISWDDAVAAGKITVTQYNRGTVNENVKVYLTGDMPALEILYVESTVTDFQFCLNGYDYTIPANYYNFIQDKGSQANIGVYNCKTTGKISKPEDNSGQACCLFKFANGSNFTLSGVNLEVYSSGYSTIIQTTGGDINISNSIIKAPRIGSGNCNTNILSATKDAESPNKVTITNSYLYSDYGVISSCSADLEIEGSTLETGTKSTIALFSSGNAIIEDSEIYGRTSASGNKVDFDNVIVLTGTDYYDVVIAQPNSSDAEYSFKDCVFTGANGSNQRGIMMGNENYPNSKYTIDNVVIENCKYDLYLQPSSISVEMDVKNIPDGINYTFGCNYSTSNSGPIITSAYNYVDRLILSNKSGCGLKAEENGDGYDITYMPYGIIKQPESDNPTVEVVSSATAHYEWYLGHAIELLVTTENVDGQSIKGSSYTTNKSVYNEETGYWSPGTDGSAYDSYYPYFKALAGDEIVVMFDRTITGCGLYFGDVYKSISGDSVRFVVNSQASDALYLTGDNPNAKVMVIRRELGAKLEGQNTKTLTGAPEGTYICKITWADGTVCYSDEVEVGSSYTIEKTTATNGTFEVKGSAVEGEPVTIVTRPNAGYVLNAIVVTDAAGNEIAIDVLNGKGEFTMPATNVTITVTFTLNILDNPNEPGDLDNPDNDGDAGDIKVENAEDNDFKAEIENVKDVINNIIVTEEEQQLIDGGESMTIILELNNIGVSADTEEKEEILKEIDDMKLGTFINVELIKKIGSYTSNITKTKGDIRISFVLPEALKNTDNKITRTYYIMRNHEGEITLIPVEFDEETSVVTFATDRFSTYAIVYKDSSVDNNTNADGDTNAGADSNLDAVPETGDTSGMYIYVLVACMAIAVFVCKNKIVAKLK